MFRYIRKDDGDVGGGCIKMAYEAKKALLTADKGIGTEYYKNHSQHILNKSFLNASNVYDVKAQIGNTREYEPITVRIGTALAKSNLQTNLYDKQNYKKISFSDLNYRPRLGQYFKMQDGSIEFTWLTIETDNEFNMFNTVIVQKCNSRLYSLDSNNNLMEIFCTTKDVTQYGTSLLTGSQADYPNTLGTSIVPITRETLKLYEGQRVMMLNKFWKITKINNENSSVEYGLVNQGILRLTLQQNLENLETDSIMADRYLFHSRPNIQLEYEKLMTFNIGDKFRVPIKILKNGVEYDELSISYNILDCPTLSEENGEFTMLGYGENNLKIHLSEPDYDEIILININCVDTNISKVRYKIDNESQAYDNYFVKRFVEKTYILNKYIDDVLVNSNATPSFELKDILDESKIEVSIVGEKIIIYNIGLTSGSIEISFDDNGVITKQSIGIIK